MDSGLWQKYLALMDKVGVDLERLTELEQNKTKAVSKGDLPTVEECMKQEQVMSLSLRGLEQKRVKMLTDLQLSGVRLRDLPDHAPKELYQQTKKAAERLRQRYEVYQAASQVAMDTLECNLRAIERTQAALNAPPKEDRPPQSDFLA